MNTKSLIVRLTNIFLLSLIVIGNAQAQDNPSPSVARLEPDMVAAGGGDFTLEVGGGNFIPPSVVRVNGTDRATTYVSVTRLTARIAAEDIRTAGALRIGVFNPPPGGGVAERDLQIVTHNLPWLRTNAPQTDVVTVAACGEALFAALSTGGVQRSNDGGRTWAAVNQGLVQSVLSLACNGTTVFAGTNGGGVFRLPLNGEQWTKLTFPAAATVVNYVAAHKGIIFAAARERFYRSTDNGQSWTAAEQGFQTGAAVTHSVLFRDRIYAATTRGVCRSDDGARWTLVVNGLINQSFTALTVLEIDTNGRKVKTLFGATTPYADGAAGGVYRLDDNESGWRPAILNISAQRNVAVIRLAAVDAGGRLFAVVATTGATDEINEVLISTDQGRSWEPFRLGLPQRRVNDLIAMRERLFAATKGTGVYVNELRSISQVGVASAASFAPGQAAPEMVTVAFGTNLAGATETAETLPLPTRLASVQVVIRDSINNEHLAPLFFASPTQINFLLPAGTTYGQATVIVRSADATVGLGTVNVVRVVPGLFSANSDGQGVASAVAVRVKADGTQQFELVAVYNEAERRFVTAEIDLSREDEQVYLAFYGTGLRLRSSLARAVVHIADEQIPVSYIGPQGQFAGLDQVNILLPRSLMGIGEVDVRLTVDGSTANRVTIAVR